MKNETFKIYKLEICSMGGNGMGNEYTRKDKTLHFKSLDEAKKYGSDKIDKEWELRYNTLDSGKVYYWYGHIVGALWIEIHEIDVMDELKQLK